MKTNIVFILVALLIWSCGQPEPRKPILRKTSSFMKESIERNKLINKIEEQLLEDKMSQDSLHQYISSSNGFWYYYVNQNKEAKPTPKAGDEVLFDYEIKTLNDSILYTREELGTKNYLVDKEELITGLQDGIKLMQEGETITFLFPSYKAYGYTGNERVGSKEPLIYTVHLKKIINKN